MASWLVLMFVGVFLGFVLIVMSKPNQNTEQTNIVRQACKQTQQIITRRQNKNTKHRAATTPHVQALIFLQRQTPGDNQATDKQESILSAKNI